MVEQFGTELSNVAEKTNIPLKTLQQQAKDIGISTVQMAAGGLLNSEGAASMLGKLRGIAERTDKANAKPLSGEAGGVKAASVGVGSGNPEYEARSTLPADVAALEEANRGQLRPSSRPTQKPR